MRYMTEGTRYSRTLLHSFVILGGDEDSHSFQRKKLETDNLNSSARKGMVA
uniref:Uncharacterized protein n=1 Tax=Arundo donax TaxID=35708 RepID=A0A0A9F4V2_ARUDO